MNEFLMDEISPEKSASRFAKLPIEEAVGAVLTHDITEIRAGEFKRCAFEKGHVVREEDLCHLQKLGKETLFVLDIPEDEIHEDSAAYALALGLMGNGVKMEGKPREGRIRIIADQDGLLKINKEALLAFNMLGEVMCATLHNNMVVKRGQSVAVTRAIPLTIKKSIVQAAVRVCRQAHGIIELKAMRKPRVGMVITGNEIYRGRIADAFAPVIAQKIRSIGGKIVGAYIAPDDESFIEAKLRELIKDSADLLIALGGMSVDPDDVTRFAIRNLGAADITYGAAVQPGSMFLVGYLDNQPTIPILGIPSCGMFAATTVFDLILPRVLAGERIGRRELAELGHGGLCMKCETCCYPACSFGK